MLEILSPGLLGPLPALPEPFPSVPVLDRLLARSDPLKAPIRDPLEILMDALGVVADPQRDWPSAPLCLLGEETGLDPAGYWLHADPVQLRPDRDQLLLFAGRAIAPSRAEADCLVDRFNRHFRDDGLWLVAPTPARWYLRVERMIQLRTRPLHQVAGGPIGEALPTGPAASLWMRWLNEAQMLFFQSDVNRARARQGRPLISGIWVWGGGSLPALNGNLPDLLVGDHPLTRGLARHAGISHQALADWSESAPGTSERCLVYWDPMWIALQEWDLTAWCAALVDLEGRLAGLASQFRQGRLLRLELDPCRGRRFRLSSGQRHRFWRRRGVRSWLEIAGAGTAGHSH